MAGDHSEDLDSSRYDFRNYSGTFSPEHSHWDKAIQHYIKAGDIERQALDHYGTREYGEVIYDLLDSLVARGYSVTEAIRAYIDNYKNGEYEGTFYFPQESATEQLRYIIDSYINSQYNGSVYINPDAP